jgi:hypothetical protein
MAKQAISVTLETENLAWLRGRVGAAGLRSVSDLLDRLVADARAKGSVGPVASVVGTIDIDASDPLLLGADEVLRASVDRSLGRPLRVKEDSPGYSAPRTTDTKRRKAHHRG